MKEKAVVEGKRNAIKERRKRTITNISNISTNIDPLQNVSFTAVSFLLLFIDMFLVVVRS